MTAAQQAAQEKQIEDLMAMVAALTTAQEPAAKPTNKAAATKGKAATIRRNLDPIVITTDDEDITFNVVAASDKGTIYANGARVQPMIGGRVQRSFTADAVVALTENADAIVKACHAIDKRALLGAHKPVPATTTES